MNSTRVKIIPEIDSIKFISKIIIKENGCWGWSGKKTFYGYSRFHHLDHDNKWQTYFAHRVSYSIFNGPLNTSLVIDHICRNRECVNPDHLRQVTQQINTIENCTSPVAANHNKTQCPRGHTLSGENLMIKNRGKSRCCRRCHLATGRKQPLI